MSVDQSKQSVIEAIYASARKHAPRGHVVAPARPSVACILWRGHRDAPEIYMAQRSPELAFLGGCWTFPGGAIEASDADGYAAAVREMSEELGLVLSADPERFVFAGRWVTPAFSPIRFDTNYYLVELDPSSEPDWSASGGELCGGEWHTPQAIVQRWNHAEWFVPSPVLSAIQALESGIQGAGERAAQAATKMNGGPRLWELVPGVVIAPLRTPTLPPATHTNCYLFGRADMIVVDPASPYPDEQRELERVLASLAEQGRRVVEIWLTHHHGDHVGGAVALAASLGVPIAAHADTAARLPGIRVARLLSDGDTHDLQGPTPMRLRAVHTPGHAVGHLCFLEEHSRTLAAGDMVAGIGSILVDPSEGDMGDYLRSLRLMKQLSPRALLPAHGMPVLVARAAQAKLDSYIAHRLWREARVLEALSAAGSATPEQLVTVAYSDVPPAVHPLAERSLLAHLLKLEVDGVAQRDGNCWHAI